MNKGVKHVGIGCLGILLIGIVWFVVTFEVFSTGDMPRYQISKNKVEYKYFSMASYAPQTREMPDVNVESFELISDSYSKRQSYAKDSERVYVYGKVIDGADPKTFKIIGNNLSRDHKAIFRGTDMISDDPENFRFEGSLRKDSKFVYHLRDTIHGADPSTYKAITGRRGLGVDKDHVFCNNKLMPNSNPRTFRLVGISYWKDKTGVYDGRCNKLDIDQRTVITLKKQTNFLKDKDHIYVDAKIIKEADRASFRVLSSSFAKDKKSIFYKDRVLHGADSRTFKVIDSYYSKDKNNVYYLDKVVKGADVETFRDTLKSRISNDKTYKDKHGEIHRGERKNK